MGLLGSALFNVFDISRKFNFDENKVFFFFKAMGKGYKMNPYHNEAHGADVMLTLGHFLTLPEIFSRMSHIDILAAIIAGAGHDVGHDGRNNMFHIATSSDFAVLYSDANVLERMHAARTFQILYADEFNFMTFPSTMSKNKLLYFRQTVIEMILATDLKNSSEVQAVQIFICSTLITISQTDNPRSFY
jgi:hypothetical protein